MAEFSTVVLAPAKINLALAVTAKRNDGFHSLETVFQAISLYDRIGVKLRPQGIICHCGELSGQNNLAYQAAALFLDRYRCSFAKNEVGVEITIEKNIPLQAGLAGGSSDAAAVLRALNLLLSSPFSYQELLSLAKECGSDTAFFLKGGTQWGEGTGSELTMLPPAPAMDILVVKPKRGVATKEAYDIFDKTGRYSRLDKKQWLELLISKDKKGISRNLTNALEEAAFQLVPEIEELKRFLLKNGCLGALMSGSGSAVFGILSDTGQGKEIRRRLAEAGYDSSWVVKTVNFESV